MLNTQSVHYQDGGTPLTGFLACAEVRDDPRPGILVVHGGAGLDDHAKGRAKRLAELGFVAFACDMYGDGVAGDRGRVMAHIKEFNEDRLRLRSRAQAGIAQLASHPLVDGKLAAIGYCFGGMTVLELARGGANLTGVVSVTAVCTHRCPRSRELSRPRFWCTTVRWIHMCQWPRSVRSSKR